MKYKYARKRERESDKKITEGDKERTMLKVKELKKDSIKRVVERDKRKKG